MFSGGLGGECFLEMRVSVFIATSAPLYASKPWPVPHLRAFSLLSGLFNSVWLLGSLSNLKTSQVFETCEV